MPVVELPTPTVTELLASPDPLAVLRTVEKISTEDASAGWLLATVLPMTPVAGAGPARLVTGSTEAGGVLQLEAPARRYRLAGRWPGVAGATAAGWHAVTAELRHADGARVGCAEQPALRLVLLPAGRLRTGAPVDGGGLTGADRRELSGEDITVPAEQVIDAFGGSAATTSVAGLPLPTAQLLTRVAVALGLARRAVREFVSAAQRKSRLGAVARLAEQPQFQVDVNRAATSVRAARSLLAGELRRLPPAAGAAPTISRTDRVRVAAAALHAQQVAQQAVRLAFSKAGASSLYVGHPLERCWRDSEEVAQDEAFGAAAERFVAAAQLGRYVPGNVC